MEFFSDTNNLLSNIEALHEFPFPFATTSQCMSWEHYNELVRTMPPWEQIAGPHKDLNNKRVDLHAVTALQMPTITPLWKNFLEYHTSREFYLKIVEKFGRAFRQYHPDLEQKKGKKLEDFITDIRGSENQDADVYLDCQLSINTPVRELSTVSLPHLDSPYELFALLLYMKEPEDDAGGDLLIYKCIKQPEIKGKRVVKDDCLSVYARYPYAANNMICFVNSPFSVHAVTNRQPTHRPRLLINMSLEFIKKRDKLFKAGQHES